MITSEELTRPGLFTKTHGVAGELAATLAVDPGFFGPHPMFVCEMDGIYVPFFIDSIRERGSRGVLLKPEDVDSEVDAKLFVGKNIYILKKDLLKWEGENPGPDEEGAYADDLEGFELVDSVHGPLGHITGIEDSTANLLFIVRTPRDTTLYVPVAEPFIDFIDPETRTVGTTLPDGLINLNE